MKYVSIAVFITLIILRLLLLLPRLFYRRRQAAGVFKEELKKANVETQAAEELTEEYRDLISLSNLFTRDDCSEC